MITAFVLIRARGNRVQALGEAIAELPQVGEVYSVTGPYDLIVRAEVEDMDALGQMLSDIQLIPGLNRTLTCIVKG